MTRTTSMSARIWRSICIFILGFVVLTIVGQVQGTRTETRLAVTSDALFPAAQLSQQAESSFQQAVKGFGDAVLMQDAGAFEKAVEQGRAVLTALNSVAQAPGLLPERSSSVRQLTRNFERFFADAATVYGAVLSNPANLDAGMQSRVQELGQRTEGLKNALSAARSQFSDDLRQQIGELREASSRQRHFTLGVFAGTLILAILIVNLTIRRSVVAPVLRAIHGVREAAETAANSSTHAAESGNRVAHDAQEQAAVIQETSASLEEIGVTTRKNADQAAEADQLMVEARKRVENSTAVVSSLLESMDEVSRSSKELQAILKSSDEIAFNTNILALNAAVEAARAGAAGAGFSVVANEVRSLAQRAAEAARNSASIVEKTLASVSAGVGLVSEANRSFGEVSGTIGSVGNLVSAIATNSEEQARGVRQIGEAIARMQMVTQNNAANAHETAAGNADVLREIEATRSYLDELVLLAGHRG